MVSKQDQKRKGSSGSEPSSKKIKQSEEDISFLYLYIHWYFFLEFPNTNFLDFTV